MSIVSKHNFCIEFEPKLAQVLTLELKFDWSNLFFVLRMFTKWLNLGSPLNNHCNTTNDVFVAMDVKYTPIAGWSMLITSVGRDY